MRNCRCLKAYRNRHVRVLVFTDGFVCFRPDEVDVVCRWNDNCLDRYVVCPVAGVV